jgi:hypothetical protein
MLFRGIGDRGQTNNIATLLCSCLASKSTMSEADRSQPLMESIPKDDPSPKSIDSLLSTELYALSLEERARVLDDVHGVSNEIDEAPEFVSESLGKLEKKLETIRKKQAYDYAYALDPQYVKKRELRLRFLRSTSFDISIAASRIVQHFEAKMELFGKAKVTKDITQDDLSKEDLECLYCGYNQILPVRDQAGRGVMLGLPHLKSNLDVKHKVCLLRGMINRSLRRYPNLKISCSCGACITTSWY